MLSSKTSLAVDVDPEHFQAKPAEGEAKEGEAKAEGEGEAPAEGAAPAEGEAAPAPAEEAPAEESWNVW